jgi:FMN phosphatase YigB (HAD superfamily)
MGAIAETTRFPVEHRVVLERVAARGPVAVVTNFDDTAGAYEIMERHGIRRLVTTVVVSEAVGLRKPHAALLTMALRDLGMSPEATLMVGDDARDDVGAAEAVGADAAWIDAEGRGACAGAPTPRWVVRALSEVVPIVEGRGA